MKTFWAIVVLLLIGAGVYWFFLRGSGQGAQQGGKTVTFECIGNTSITATFYPAADTKVDLSLSDGRTMSLPHAASASGARYANADESVVFWNKGNGAFLTENGANTFDGCVLLPDDTTGTLPNTYTNATTTGGWSIRYPEGFTPDPAYVYQAMGPGKSINGVKFTIPARMATGTNLSDDTYVSIEEQPAVSAQECTAAAFLDLGAQGTTSTVTTGNGTTYSFASTTGAGAGNRYEEQVFALPGTMPCTAVRYFIHYGVIENYPLGAVQQFDHAALVRIFDAIRDSLTRAQ